MIQHNNMMVLRDEMVDNRSTAFSSMPLLVFIRLFNAPTARVEKRDHFLNEIMNGDDSICGLRKREA